MNHGLTYTACEPRGVTYVRHMLHALCENNCNKTLQRDKEEAKVSLAWRFRSSVIIAVPGHAINWAGLDWFFLIPEGRRPKPATHLHAMRFCPVQFSCTQPLIVMDVVLEASASARDGLEAVF